MLEKIQQNIEQTQCHPSHHRHSTTHKQAFLRRNQKSSKSKLAEEQSLSNSNMPNQLLGKTVTPEEVFKDGQYIDIAGSNSGKGLQGPVKRWGVTILQAKGRKTKRGIATLGPWNPHHLMYSVPRAGQMGYHQRIEFNKRILKIGKDGKEVNVKGGFIRYGEPQRTIHDHRRKRSRNRKTHHHAYEFQHVHQQKSQKHHHK